ncbi:hypothetical protein ACT453_55775, partial [Bacillus sp. D-CC]
SASVPLVIVMGVVTTSVAFFFLRKEFHTGLAIQESILSTESSKTLTSLSPRTKKKATEVVTTPITITSGTLADTTLETVRPA